jgi:ATP-dependent exoDNAse (exonuclease V) beta subunit
MINIKHPLRNINLIFNPNNHKYTDNFDRSYTSISGWVHNYFEKFDSDKIATKCALKRNVTKESLLTEWKKAGDDAALQGDVVHNMLASKFNNIDFEINNTNEHIVEKYKKQVDIIYENISKKLVPVYIEQIIFNPDTMIAGTCDALFITKELDKYVLIDWKTPKKIDMFSIYKKYGFPPFQKLMDCNYNHFCLQLSMYNSILKSQGYLKYDIPVLQRIVHILSDKSISINAVKFNV